MRVDLISFLDPEVYGGGGEMISRQLIETGRARGYDIRITSARPRKIARHERPQLTLFIDVFNHGHSLRSLGAWRGFDEAFLASAMARAPFVHLTNAYVDVCNLAYLPCSGAAAPTCPVKPLPVARRIMLRDMGDRCFATRALVRRLYEESALNVFLSPLHKSITERVLGSSVDRALVLRPMIDTRIFRNEGHERDIEYLFVGVIGEAKGLEAMRSRFRGTDIHLIGRISPGTKLDFGRYVGPVPYDEVPMWMNRARNFVFLPRWPEPQGRVVAEAALCGCTIIGNENVGALSFDFDLSDPSRYGGVEEGFWRALAALA
jgi:glycosyltransferase involved in cell wall biosynthesis